MMKQMFKRPPVQRLSHSGRRTAVRIGIGFALALLAVAGRLALAGPLQSAAPYAFVFASITISTVLGGWLSGAITLATGQMLTWFFLVSPRFSFKIDDAATGSGLVIATVSQAVIVVVIALYQREVARAVRSRDELEHAREMVVRELNHRVKNTLSVVQSIARSTFGDESRRQVQAFSGRLRALAAGHDVLTQQEWTSADFSEVVLRALEPFRKERGDQFMVEGVHFSLPPRAAVSLALAVHELATNAVKYGALSVPEGRVAISWSVQANGAFEFVWQETGGPTVIEPTRRGFGTSLIARGVASEIGAAVDLDFLPSGLVCRFSGQMQG